MQREAARYWSALTASPFVALPQVLDDSTCKATRQLVDEKAAEWAERGVKCEVVRRTNRQGYKAGALKDVSADHHLPDCA